MTTIVRKEQLWLGLALVFLASGCAAEDDDTTAVAGESLRTSQVEILIPDDVSSPDREPIEAEARQLAESLSAVVDAVAMPKDRNALRVEYIGKGKLVDGGQVVQPEAVPEDDKTVLEVSESNWDVFLPEHQNVYRVALGEEFLKRVGEYTLDHGLNSASGPADVEESESVTVEKGWSNNADNRDHLWNSGGAVTHSIWRRIGHASNSCTGSLIGRHHWITAAHCVQTNGTNTYFNFTARMGRNGNNWNASSSTNASPVITPSGWGAGTTPTTQFDLAIVSLPNNIGDTEGWFGYAAWTNTDIQSVTKYRRGYPVCAGFAPGTPPVARIDDPADPTPAAGSTSELTSCSNQHFYGMADPGGAVTIGNFGSSATWGGQTWHRTVEHGSDGSFGDSGSPIYGTAGDGITYVTAVESSCLCGCTATSTACTSSTAYASRALRITNEYFSAIATFLASFP